MTEASTVFTPANQITLCVWCGRTTTHGTVECLQTLTQLVRNQKTALETKNVLLRDLQYALDRANAKLNAIRREAQ